VRFPKNILNNLAVKGISVINIVLLRFIDYPKPNLLLVDVKKKYFLKNRKAGKFFFKDILYYFISK